MSARVLRERAKRVLDLYRRQGMRVATAESCTGGLVATVLTAIPGSSDGFDCSFASYPPPPRGGERRDCAGHGERRSEAIRRGLCSLHHRHCRSERRLEGK